MSSREVGSASNPLPSTCYIENKLGILKVVKTQFKFFSVEAGNGLFRKFIYQQKPNLHFTLVNISGKMLFVSREHFVGELSNITYKEFDFSRETIMQKYDRVMSALAIHGLEDEQKETL